MEYEKYLYDTEQMKADVRTYIALGIMWTDFHIRKIKEQKEKKAEKLKVDMNEYILKAWDKVDYFEKIIGKDIIASMPDLDEEEKQFVIIAKELRNKTNQNKIFPKGFKSDADYARKLIDRLTSAEEQLVTVIEQDKIESLNSEVSKNYLKIGDTFMFHRLEPYIDQFTPEEQQYINEGRMAKIGSEYAEGAEKARKFLATCDKFEKAGDRITQVGVGFNKAMTSKGEELGDKIRQAGVKLSPAIINLGEDVVEFVDKLQEKSDDMFAKIQWKGLKRDIKEQCLKIYPNAPEEAIEIKAEMLYYESRDYILNEYLSLKEKAETLREHYIKQYGQDINEQEYEAYLSTQIPDYKKYKNFTKNYIYFYNIFVKHDYEYVNS